MRITLNKLIKKYYKELNYLGTSLGKKNKQYLRIENKDFAKTLIEKYNNLNLIYTYAENAPELHKYFITLK